MPEVIYAVLATLPDEATAQEWLAHEHARQERAHHRPEAEAPDLELADEEA